MVDESKYMPTDEEMDAAASNISPIKEDDTWVVDREPMKALIRSVAKKVEEDATEDLLWCFSDAGELLSKFDMKHPKSAESTPPVMFREWIACVINQISDRYTREIGILETEIRELNTRLADERATRTRELEREKIGAQLRALEWVWANCLSPSSTRVIDEMSNLRATLARDLERVPPDDGPGTPSARLTWFLDQLAEMFPGVSPEHDSSPPEPKYLKAITTTIDRVRMEAWAEALKSVQVAASISRGRGWNAFDYDWSCDYCGASSRDPKNINHNTSCLWLKYSEARRKVDAALNEPYKEGLNG